MDTPKRRKKAVSVPPAQVSRGKKIIRVSCALDSVPEERIRIDLEKNRLSISAANDNGEFVRKIRVPEGSWISRKTFRDGLLEIVLMRPE